MNDHITALEQALRPFAACADQLDEETRETGREFPDDEWAKFRLLVSDYRRARAALAASRAAHDCHQPDLVTANQAERTGWNAAIAWLEKYLADYVSEHGNYDYSTGVTEFPDDGEWAGSVQEIIDGMRLAMPAALDLTPAPAPAVEPVVLTAQDAARVPEIAALIKAARKVHRSYWHSTDGIIQGMYDFGEALRAIGGGA